MSILYPCCFVIMAPVFLMPFFSVKEIALLKLGLTFCVLPLEGMCLATVMLKRQ